MLNVFCISGTVASKPECIVQPNGIKQCVVKVAVKRPYANAQGIYESDLLFLETWRGLADTASMVVPGTCINATGRIATRMSKDGSSERPQYAFVVERMDIVS